jgi:hypothetical protein
MLSLKQLSIKKKSFLLALPPHPLGEKLISLLEAPVLSPDFSPTRVKMYLFGYFSVLISYS